jgi:hypothetical protein
MPFEFLLMALAGMFFLVLAYVAWLKFREHLHAHRHEHDARPHHVVWVRKYRPKSRTGSSDGTTSRSRRR